MVLSLPSSTFPISLGKQAPDTVTMRYKFETGAKKHFLIDSEMNLKVNANGQENPVQMSSKTDYIQTVKSIGEDGSAVMDIKFLSIQSILNGNPQPIPENITSVPSSLKLSPIGKVDSINLPGQGLKDGGLKLDGMQIGGQLPSDPVHVGSQWNSTATIPMMGELTLKNTIDKIELVDGKLLVTVKGDSVFDMGKMLTQMASAEKLKGEGTAKMHYEWVFDVTTGCMRTSHMDTDLNAVLSSMTGGSSIKETGTQIYDLKLVS